MAVTWNYFSNLSFSDADYSDIIRKAGIPQSILQILLNRGYSSAESILEYLRPSLFSLHSPFLFKDMPKIVLRLEKALASREKVLIYGDYDADGVSGTALLYRALSTYGFEAMVHLPDREEGYGLHKEIIAKAAKNGINLIITVDCGITAVEEISYASSLGIEVIITDHHEPSLVLPPALGILNPKVAGSGYPFTALAGVGVAFKLVQALSGRFAQESLPTGPEFKPFSEFKYLDLVALGTIADIVPLVGENRLLVKYGLEAMEHTENTGLKALLQECGLAGRKLKSGQISFVVAPRINAAGRMDTAKLALNLLLTENSEDASEIAGALSKENSLRQQTEREILEDAQKMLDQGPVPDVIVLSSATWHHGVIGIVASRLVERYHRPVYLIAREGETGKGSARGIPGYHVQKELEQSATLLTKFGGHMFAAGFSLPAANIDGLRKELNRRYGESGLTYEEQFQVDSIVPGQELAYGLQKELEQMAPFGAGNPAPLLRSNNLGIVKTLTVGKQGEHLKLILQAGENKFEALFFKNGGEIERIKNINCIDIVFSLEINDYGGEKKIQAVLRDYRPAGEEAGQEIACSTENHKSAAGQGGQEIFRLTREDLVLFYKRLRVELKDGNCFWKPDPKEPKQSQMIRILEELGLVNWLGGTNPYRIRLNADEKKNLADSLRFRLFSPDQA